jgi:hypothetical protein
MARPPKPITLRIKRDAREFLPPELVEHADAANWLQDRIIRLGAMGKARPDDPIFVPLKAKYLERDVGWRVASKIIPWMMENELLERTNNYFVGQSSFGYRLGPPLCDLPTYQTLLKAPDFIRRIRRQRDADEKSWRSERRHLKNWANRISLNPGIVAAVLTSLPKACHESVIECMAAISDGQTFHTFCEYGRAHTAVTRLKRELRCALTFAGRALVNIDIANSQPLILGATMRNDLARAQAMRSERRARGSNETTNGSGPAAGERDGASGMGDSQGVSLRPPPLAVASIRSPSTSGIARKGRKNKQVTDGEFSPELPCDLKLFLSLCEDGKLYDFLIRESIWRSTQGAWKDRVWFRFLYGSPKTSDWTPKEGDKANPTQEDINGMRSLVTVFKKRFPNVLRWIDKQKRDNRGGLAKKMQTLESKVVIGGVVRALAEKYADVPFATIHDSLLILPEHVGLIRGLLAEEFGKVGVRPTMREEHYTLKAAA